MLRERLAVRDRVVEQLKAALEETEGVAEAEAAAARSSAATLGRELAQLQVSSSALSAALELRPTAAAVEALDLQIRTLQALVDVEDADALEAAMEAGASGDADAGPLAAAQNRNRRLNDALAGAQRAGAAARRDAEMAHGRAEAAERTAAERGGTIEQLEEHLITAVGRSRSGAGAGARADAGTSDAIGGNSFGDGGAGAGGADVAGVSSDGTEQGAGVRGGGAVDDEGFIIRAIMAPSNGVAEWEKNTNQGRQDGGGARDVGENRMDAGLIPVVIGQRDRYKRRVTDLEARVGDLEASLVTASSEGSKLHADNVTLFEKVRYLQTYYAKQVETHGRGGEATAGKIVRVDDAGVPVVEGAFGSLGGGSGGGHRYACGIGPMQIAVDSGAAVNMRRRAQRYGCLPGGSGGGESTKISEVPGGDASGAVARYDVHYQRRLDPKP